MSMTNRRERRDVMLAYPFEEKRLATWPLPWLVQPKYDGLRCRAAILSTGVELYSSTGMLISTVPHINSTLADYVQTPMILDGELYIHGEHSFQRLASIVNRGEVHPDHVHVRLVIFDLINAQEQVYRLLELLKYDFGPFTQLAPNTGADSVEDIEYALKRSMEYGYEGIILRHPRALYQPRRVTTMMKWKPRKSDFYMVVGFEEEMDKYGHPKGRLGALVVRDQDGRIFNVGTGFTAAQRAEYWRNPAALINRVVEVKYQALTRDQIPRFPVYSRII